MFDLKANLLDIIGSNVFDLSSIVLDLKTNRLDLKENVVTYISDLS